MWHATVVRVSTFGIGLCLSRCSLSSWVHSPFRTPTAISPNQGVSGLELELHAFHWLFISLGTLRYPSHESEHAILNIRSIAWAVYMALWELFLQYDRTWSAMFTLHAITVFFSDPWALYVQYVFAFLHRLWQCGIGSMSCWLKTINITFLSYHTVTENPPSSCSRQSEVPLHES